ncbi:MAG: fasciclin domain-containing protein [Planctomycetes bacterium]|nr:fasciclin domain-containing protein [Planctomycetota bacterium]
MKIAIVVLTVLLVAGGIWTMRAQEGQSQPPAEPAAQPDRSMLEMLQKDGHYKILLAALNGTELEKTLAGKGRYTFFAPRDEAFERVPDLSKLLDDAPRLQAVLNRHLLDGLALETKALRDLRRLTPKQGEELEVSGGKEGKPIEINDAKILAPDGKASNGILHGIDHVLMKNNDSMLREAGAAVERGIKKGVEDVKNAFKTDEQEKEAPAADEKTAPAEQPAE